MKSKKGFVGDYMLYAIFLFILAIAIFMIAYIVNSTNTAWQDAPNIPTESKSIMSNFQSRFAGVWDAWYLVLVIGFALITIIIAFALRSHPAFAIFTFLILIILGIIAVSFSNTFHDIATDSAFEDIANDFSITTYLAQRLPHIVIIFGVIFIIILYAKTRSQGYSL